MKKLSILFFALVLGLFFFGADAFANRLILKVPGLGKVEANPSSRQLIFTAFKPGKVPMEYSIWTPRGSMQSEAGGWAKPEFRPAVKREKMPHYVPFIITISRYEKIGVAICRENDGRIGCKVIR